MKIKLVLLALIIFPTVFAAEEQNIWSCEGISSIGFFWQGGTGKISPMRHLVISSPLAPAGMPL